MKYTQPQNLPAVTQEHPGPRPAQERSRPGNSRIVGYCYRRHHAVGDQIDTGYARFTSTRHPLSTGSKGHPHQFACVPPASVARYTVMAKLARTSTRPFSRDWLFELYDNTKSAINDKPLRSVRNAWVPEPARWIQRLRSTRLVFVNRVLGLQTCMGLPLSFNGKRRVNEDVVAGRENYNKFHRSMTNISTPRGMRRTEFEADIHQGVESYLSRNASIYAVDIPVGIVLICLTVGSIISAAANVNASLWLVATAAIISTVTVFAIGFATEFLIATVKWRMLRPFLTATYISVASWAGIQIFAGGTASGVKNGTLWQTTLLFLLFGLGTRTAISLLGASIITSAQRLFYVRGGLDNYLLAFLLDLYHFITVHKEDWGQATFQGSVNQELSAIAALVETYLPGRLAVAQGRNQRKRRTIAKEIGQAIRSHADDVMRNDGRARLRQLVNSYLPFILRGAWLELPREACTSRLDALLKRAKPLTASLIPAAVMFCLRETNVVAGNYETYGWLFASLWFAVSIGTWIDPGLAERLKLMNSMISIFKGRDEIE
jgi:hypothetical protein